MLQIFDAVIVLTSFGLDLVFIEGITEAQSESAIALLIIFLLWRILRIVNSRSMRLIPRLHDQAGSTSWLYVS